MDDRQLLVKLLEQLLLRGSLLRHVIKRANPLHGVFDGDGDFDVHLPLGASKRVIEDPVRPPPRACAVQARPSASRPNTRARAGGPSSPRSRRPCRGRSRAVARLLVKRRQPRVDLRVLRTRGLLRSRSALPRLLLLGLLPPPSRSCFSALRCRTSSSFHEEVLQRSVGNSRRRDTSSASVLASPPRACAAAGPAFLVSLRWIPGDWPKQLKAFLKPIKSPQPH